MRIRQVALVARDLDAALAELCGTLGLTVAFNDPGVEVFGLRNAVLPAGDTFLEVVSPLRDGTSAGRFLDRRGGDGGYMVIFQTDDLSVDRARMADLGVRVVWEIAFDDMATIHLHPLDLGGAIVSLDQPKPPESWRWAGSDWAQAVRGDVVSTIAGVEIAAADPRAVAERWSRALALPAQPCGPSQYEIVMDGGTVRFAPDGDRRGDGVAGLVLHAADPARRGEHTICGTRIRLV